MPLRFYQVSRLSLSIQSRMSSDKVSFSIDHIHWLLGFIRPLMNDSTLSSSIMNTSSSQSLYQSLVSSWVPLFTQTKFKNCDILNYYKDNQISSIVSLFIDHNPMPSIIHNQTPKQLEFLIMQWCLILNSFQIETVLLSFKFEPLVTPTGTSLPDDTMNSITNNCKSTLFNCLLELKQVQPLLEWSYHSDIIANLNSYLSIKLRNKRYCLLNTSVNKDSLYLPLVIKSQLSSPSKLAHTSIDLETNAVVSEDSLNKVPVEYIRCDQLSIATPLVRYVTNIDAQYLLQHPQAVDMLGCMLKSGVGLDNIKNKTLMKVWKPNKEDQWMNALHLF